MPVVEFDGVSKYFHRHAKQMLLRERIVQLIRNTSGERFYALRDICFSLNRGDSLAIIGHNGAGKSTLLNLATGVCKPSEGSITMNGRVVALLELGAGFHPDLTATENVSVNAALLGLTRLQVRSNFDRIVEFAGLGDFMNQPLRTFSNGMVLRLAFSIAITVDADILVVDEILGVGDQAFHAKSMEKLTGLCAAGKTLICASHSLDAMQELCTHALWLDHGRVVRFGGAREVIGAYRDSNPAHAAVNVQTG